MSVNNSTMQIDASKANVLVPTQYLQQVSPWHVARTSIVTVNPDPNYGDVYKVGSRWNEQKKAAEDIFALGKPALMRIAAAAGIVWNWRESGPQVIQKDYVVYKAVGALRLPDGSWQPIVATKEIDLTVIEEETYEANLKKALEYASDPKKQAALKGMTPEQWAQAQTKAAMIQWRKNKLMRAETGAMLLPTCPMQRKDKNGQNSDLHRPGHTGLLWLRPGQPGTGRVDSGIRRSGRIWPDRIGSEIRG